MFIIFDLDGTLADIEHRRHFVSNGNTKWDSFHAACVNDRPIKEVIQVLHALGHLDDTRIEVWSGRMDTVRPQTEKWLIDNLGYLPILKMRKNKDYTPDHKLKLSWLQQSERKPDMVFDDRDRVVAMWREQGIRCLQVAPGDF